MYFKCRVCDIFSKADEWNYATMLYFNQVLEGIEKGYLNINYRYICPYCGSVMYKNDWHGDSVFTVK